MSNIRTTIPILHFNYSGNIFGPYRLNNIPQQNDIVVLPYIKDEQTTKLFGEEERSLKFKVKGVSHFLDGDLYEVYVYLNFMESTSLCSSEDQSQSLPN